MAYPFINGHPNMWKIKSKDDQLKELQDKTETPVREYIKISWNR